MNPKAPEHPWLLLVEDSPADVYLVQEAVRQEGLRFDWKVAEDGETAIQIIDRVDADVDAEAPGVLLLDINVPRRSGNHVLEHFCKSPRCGMVPVIMISSWYSPGERKRSFDLGADEYFRKPSSLDEFMTLGSVVRRVHEAGRKAPAMQAGASPKSRL